MAGHGCPRTRYAAIGIAGETRGERGRAGMPADRTVPPQPLMRIRFTTHLPDPPIYGPRDGG